MLHQNLVQQRVADLNAMSHLPPLNNLPQWARVNMLDKARYPRPFEKDKQAFLSNQMLGTVQGNDGESGDREVNEKMKHEAEGNGENPYRRIQHLERNLAFLKQQHSEFLHCLHEEIDDLKRENKDLNFRIVMSQQNSKSTVSSAVGDSRLHTGEQQDEEEEEVEGSVNDITEVSPIIDEHGSQILEADELIIAESKLEKELSSLSLKSKSITNASTKTPSQDDKLEELKIIFLEEEVRKLRHAYQELRNRNSYLSQLLEQSEDRRRRQMTAIDSLRYQLAQFGVKFNMDNSLPRPQSIQSYAISSDLIPQQRNVPELEAIIKHLQQVNERQAHELESLKSDLRDVLYSHKWTPDAYLLAKAYIADDDAKSPVKDHNSKFNKVQLKQGTRKLPDVSYVADSITLPPLKQTMGNRAVERRKRTQILQKQRLRHGEVLQ